MLAIAGSFLLIAAICGVDVLLPKVSFAYAQVFAILLFASAAPYRAAVVLAIVTAGLEAALEGHISNSIHLFNRAEGVDIAFNAGVMATSFVAVVTLFDRLRASFARNAALERAAQIASILEKAYEPGALPEFEGLVLDARYVPAATELNVGGDWYDVLALPDRRMLICVGDVTGHGADAALRMGRVRQSIVSAAANSDDAGQILASVNRAVLLQDSGFATAFVGLLDPATLQLTYAGAGHPPPVVASRSGATRTLEGSGPILGAVPDPAYRERSTRLESGDLLIVYTDGLIEFDRRLLEAESKLAEIARELAAQPGTADPAAAVHRRMLADATQNDDIVVLTVRVIESVGG